MADAPRDIQTLLTVVGAHPSLPYAGSGISEAYADGLITAREVRMLQSHSKRSVRGQKIALREARPVTDKQVEKMRAKLGRVGAKLWPDMEVD